MNRRSALLLAMCIVPAIVLLYMSSLALGNGRQMYQFYTGIFCAVFCFLPWLLYRFRLMTLPMWMNVFILLAVFFHSYGVLVMQYDNLVWYDTVTHSFSSYVISLCTLLTLFCLQRYNGCIHFSLKVMTLFVVLIMVSFGVIWEVFEYVVDQTTGTCMQYAPWDTIRDMFCNSFGSVMASLFVVAVMRKTSIEEFIDRIELHQRLRKFLAKADDVNQ